IVPSSGGQAGTCAAHPAGVDLEATNRTAGHHGSADLFKESGVVHSDECRLSGLWILSRPRQQLNHSPPRQPETGELKAAEADIRQLRPNRGIRASLEAC